MCQCNNGCIEKHLTIFTLEASRCFDRQGKAAIELTRIDQPKSYLGSFNSSKEYKRPVFCTHLSLKYPNYLFFNSNRFMIPRGSWGGRGRRGPPS
jgi:hypothetical protein